MSILYLYWLFLKIGLLTFGGGYAMIPLFQTELVTRHGLLTATQFADFVALAQMTPGPVGLNAATYIGQQQAGIAGAIAATLGVTTPSLTIGILIAVFLHRFEKSAVIQAALRGIRPATLGLIAAAVIFFAETSVFSAPAKALWSAGQSFGISWRGLLIFVATLVVSYRWHVNMLWLLIGGGLAGWLLALI
jgi:chromate transporter